MKNLLLASTMLVATASIVAADVTLSGDARMGVTNNNAARDIQFTSRARVTFKMEGSTDTGLTYGASFRADQAAAAAGNTAMTGGSVYVSGAFGKLAMGDVDSAANAIVGHVGAISLTGLGDTNELGYLGNTDTAALYTYEHSSGFSAGLSFGQLTGGKKEMSVAVKYATEMFYVALGYEETDATAAVAAVAPTPGNVGAAAVAAAAADEQLTLGIGANFSGFSVKLVAADRKSWADTHYALSAGYKMGNLSVTAFATEEGAVDNAGIGASYGLGGGLTLTGGVAKATNADAVFDLGLSMKF